MSCSFCLISFLIFPVLYLVSAGCSSQNCKGFSICYPFVQGSNKTCENHPAYNIQCQNDILTLHNRTVSYVDYHNMYMFFEGPCKDPNATEWKEFLKQVPDANAQYVDCNAIHWNHTIDHTCGNISQTEAWIIVGFSLAIISICPCILVVLFLFTSKRILAPEDDVSSKISNHSVKSITEITSPSHGREASKMFTYRELEQASCYFSPDLKLGKGGFGTVYKGTLHDGTLIAIKRSHYRGDDNHSTEDFVNEIAVLSQVNHRNLVRLHGCCVENGCQLLVYEYISNGTLYDHLHGKKFKGQELGWDRRINIAVQTAEALAYLHSSADPPIFHRDVKSSNILLDETFAAKVSDFGLSRFVPLDASHVSTVIRGTPGYIDPRYYETYRLTDKSDVYSFGVVLLELITGLKPIDFDRHSIDVNLSAYAIPYITRGELSEIIDPRLKATSHSEIFQNIALMAELAVKCLAFLIESRPTMRHVLQELIRIRGLNKIRASVIDFQLNICTE